MYIDIPFPVARTRHFDAVCEIMDKLKKGKSKHRNALAGELRWRYSWCLWHQGFSFAEIANGQAQRQQEAEDAMSENEAVLDLIKRTGVSLQADKGHWWGSALLTEVPLEIVRLHRQSIIQRRAEKAAYAALPPNERQRLFEEAVTELRKDPGFVGVIGLADHRTGRL
jgi:hypothetical protein